MKKILLDFVGGCVLVTGGLSTIATGQAVKDVNVVNSPNVNVVNTPAVTVANTPTVNVGNTASVNVANNPNVSVTNTPNVTIANSPTQPALTSRVDDPGRIPFQQRVTLRDGQCVGQGTCFFPFGAVPGKFRVVIQNISGLVEYDGNPSAIGVYLNDPGSDQPLVTFSAPIIPNTTPVQIRTSFFTQPTLAYFGSGVNDGVIGIVVTVFGESTFSARTGAVETLTLTGYQLDCTIAPCAPIAIAR